MRYGTVHLDWGIPHKCGMKSIKVLQAGASSISHFHVHFATLPATCCTFLRCGNSLHTHTHTYLMINLCCHNGRHMCRCPLHYTLSTVALPSLLHSPSPSSFGCCLLASTYAHNFALISFFSHAICLLRVFFNFKWMRQMHLKAREIGRWERARERTPESGRSMASASWLFITSPRMQMRAFLKL